MKRYEEIRSALLRLCKKENLKLIEADLKDKELVLVRRGNAFILNKEVKLE